jgi:hypothetical protein
MSVFLILGSARCRHFAGNVKGGWERVDGLDWLSGTYGARSLPATLSLPIIINRRKYQKLKPDNHIKGRLPEHAYAI